MFQYLPASDGGFYVAFKTGAGSRYDGAFGMAESFSVSALRELSKQWRRNGIFGWIFQSPLLYVKESNQLFKFNSLADAVLPSVPLPSDQPYYSKLPSKTWSEFIADNQEGCVVASTVPRPFYYPLSYPGDRYGSYNNLEPPEFEPPIFPDDYPAAMRQMEIDKRSAMAIEIARNIEKEKEKIEKGIEKKQIWATQVAGWETPWQSPYPPLKQALKPPSPKPMPAPIPEPVVKAKFGRMIKLVTPDDD